MKNKTSLLLSLSLISSVNAMTIPEGEFGLSLGGANIHQGQSQFVGIQHSFGNNHQVIHNNENTFVGGLGYLFKAFSNKKIDLSLGANIYYLSSAKVNGIIFLERTFPNLAYQYETRHIPLYATAKASFHDTKNALALVTEVGVGPNFLKTKNYHERTLDNGVTIPNQAFNGESSTKLSAMAGVGLRLNNIWKNSSLEVGYKYFYLNEGHLNPRPQVLNQLTTGKVDAHALMITLTA